MVKKLAFKLVFMGLFLISAQGVVLADESQQKLAHGSTSEEYWKKREEALASQARTNAWAAATGASGVGSAALFFLFKGCEKVYEEAKSNLDDGQSSPHHPFTQGKFEHLWETKTQIPLCVASAQCFITAILLIKTTQLWLTQKQIPTPTNSKSEQS